MDRYFSSEFSLGILGGGQLGKMLLTETQKWDINTHVLDPSPDAPCKTGCNFFTQGDLMDYQTVIEFGKNLDVLTIEIEGVNLEALSDLETSGVKTYPRAETLRFIQDKGIQKSFYLKHNIPTAPFRLFESRDALIKAYEMGDLALPQVWKIARGGYDGKGVQILRSPEVLLNLPQAPCVIEQLIPFTHELAVIVARSPSGQEMSYPVVEMEFHPEANQVEYVICPARIEESLAQKAQEVALQVSRALKHEGLLAVELFATSTGDILVNEVAPRPHNSGHYSIEASYTNQFEQHLRAILDLPLGDTLSKAAGIMVNLVGAEGHTGPVYYENIEKILAIPGVTPHIYGKKETRPFRKMGHVTIIHRDMEQARSIAEQVKNNINVISKS
ncbi:MAG TPA: 5-(carboxyamino)imidazole ribonucleotide synthase [Flavobacteriaceae bacterium]|nr:5-(carboxyamino)imidazole ribonucleotide synthase [Flavobacteriaceae bacterium]